MKVNPLLPVLCLLSSLAAAEELTCLEADTPGLYSWLQQQAYQRLDARDAAFEKLESPDDIRAYQANLREEFVQALGGFPERSPLNAAVVGKIPGKEYTIEKVIFESQPGHHVTANLYLPKGEGPFPAVIVSSGHSRTGKTAAYNQRFGIIMAKHGMAGFCFDPIGQGERSQIVNESGKPRFSGTTTEHFLIGVGSILVGRNTARYRIWDAMRCVDYLASRPDIDSKRIGMTGCSGGGTLTSYVMALDDRIACAAPACYLTTLRRLIETIGPQDAEQNIFGQLTIGLDQPDYVLLRAPKPTLISSTTSDFFDVQGSWENFRQAKRTYAKLGFPERVDLVESAGKHGVPMQNLATIAHWMKRWLLNVDESIPAEELPTLPPAALLCTDTGQVLDLTDEKSVFDLNADYERTLSRQRKTLWEKSSDDVMRASIRDRLNISAKVPAPKAMVVGRVDRDGYTIERLVLKRETGAPLPTLIYKPAKASGKRSVYLHENGKAGDEPAIRQLVASGTMVIAVDLQGQGETARSKRNEQLGDWKTFFLSYLMSKSLTGMRTADTLAIARFANRYESSSDEPVELIAAGQTGIVALHAAALDPAAYASVRLKNAPTDWASIVGDSEPAGYLDYTVHGALTSYDLPDLARLAGKVVRE